MRGSAEKGVKGNAYQSVICVSNATSTKTRLRPSALRGQNFSACASLHVTFGGAMVVAVSETRIDLRGGRLTSLAIVHR